MKIAIAAIAVLAVTGMSVPASAQQPASSYRYCLQESGGGPRGGGGTLLCRFNTYAQCMASKTGWTDFCILNPSYGQRK
jgi:hypothetical protein